MSDNIELHSAKARPLTTKTASSGNIKQDYADHKQMKKELPKASNAIGNLGDGFEKGAVDLIKQPLDERINHAELSAGVYHAAGITAKFGAAIYGKEIGTNIGTAAGIVEANRENCVQAIVGAIQQVYDLTKLANDCTPSVLFLRLATSNLWKVQLRLASTLGLQGMLKEDQRSLTNAYDIVCNSTKKVTPEQAGYGTAVAMSMVACPPELRLLGGANKVREANTFADFARAWAAERAQATRAAESAGQTVEKLEISRTMASATAKNNYSALSQAPAEARAQFLTNKEAEQFRYTHASETEPKGTFGRVGNYRLQTKKIEQLTKDGKKVYKPTLVRVYDVIGVPGKLIVPDKYAKSLRQARDLKLTWKSNQKSGYEAKDYLIKGKDASAVRQQSSKDTLRLQGNLLFNSGSRVFPEAGLTQPLTGLGHISIKAQGRRGFESWLQFERSEKDFAMYQKWGVKSKQEDIARHIVAQPNPAIVPEWHIANHFREGDKNIAGDATHPSHVIRFFRPEFDALEVTPHHEWAHILDFQSNPQRREAFATAVKLEHGLEPSGFNTRKYGATDLWENFAVQSEALLSADPALFAKATNKKAMLRTAIIAKALRGSLEAPGGELSVHREDYLKRVKYIEENITPKAVESLLDPNAKDLKDRLSILPYIVKPQDTVKVADKVLKLAASVNPGATEQEIYNFAVACEKTNESLLKQSTLAKYFDKLINCTDVYCALKNNPHLNKDLLNVVIMKRRKEVEFEQFNEKHWRKGRLS